MNSEFFTPQNVRTSAKVLATAGLALSQSKYNKLNLENQIEIIQLLKGLPEKMLIGTPPSQQLQEDGTAVFTVPSGSVAVKYRSEAEQQMVFEITTNSRLSRPGVLVFERKVNPKQLEMAFEVWVRLEPGSTDVPVVPQILEIRPKAEGGLNTDWGVVRIETWDGESYVPGVERIDTSVMQPPVFDPESGEVVIKVTPKDLLEKIKAKFEIDPGWVVSNTVGKWVYDVNEFTIRINVEKLLAFKNNSNDENLTSGNTLMTYLTQNGIEIDLSAIFPQRGSFSLMRTAGLYRFKDEEKFMIHEYLVSLHQAVKYFNRVAGQFAQHAQDFVERARDRTATGEATRGPAAPAVATPARSLLSSLLSPFTTAQPPPAVQEGSTPAAGRRLFEAEAGE